MIDFLVRAFVKDAQDTENPRVRGRYGILAGGMGIFLNLCLFAGKFLAGVLTSSISITADAFNNLSDAGSSVVTLLGFKMAEMPADREHPFGHGRIEYISGLAVSAAILLVGFELIKSSVGKILHPSFTQFSILSMGILAVSILVKLWMSHFNRTLGRRISSTAMAATAADSLTDAAATSAVLAGGLISHWFGLRIDGYMGAFVALFILYSGFTTARDSLSPLLGQAPDKELVHAIEDAVMSHETIIGIHDLIVHDYGPGRRIISLHAEVPAREDVLAMHDTIDLVEMDLRRRFNCDVTIHMDPIVTEDEEVNVMRMRISDMVHEIDEALSIHDFRMVKGPTHTNLIFDVLVPFRFRLPDQVIADLVRNGVQEIGPHYFAVVRVEKAYS